MKAPLEQMESTTPMSASEGGLYVLIAGALVAVGVFIGWTQASLKNARTVASSHTPNRGSNRNNNKQQHQSKPQQS